MKWFLLVLLMVFGCVEAEANGRTVVRSRTVVRGGNSVQRNVQRNVGHHFQQQAIFATPVYQAPVVFQAAPVVYQQQQFAPVYQQQFIPQQQFAPVYAPQRAVGGCGAALFGY